MLRLRCRVRESADGEVLLFLAGDLSREEDWRTRSRLYVDEGREVVRRVVAGKSRDKLERWC